MLLHHELCFGCGRSNLFGLLLDARQDESGSVTGRCFIKQDHQGPNPGQAHPGVIAVALTEGMAFACGPGSRAASFEVTITGVAAVGTFLEVTARVESRRAQTAGAVAKASCDGAPIASASGTFSV